MSIAKAFESAFRRKREKGWDKIYVVVDIHDTILRACYQEEETYDYLITNYLSIIYKKISNVKLYEIYLVLHTRRQNAG